MDKKDWTLLAVNSAQDKGLSPVQLQKSLFLLSKELPESVGRDFYNFIPYNYGPFDQNIYKDAERLASQGLINIENVEGRSWPKYYVTPEGKKQCGEIIKTCSLSQSEAIKYLEDVIDWIKGLNFQELIRTIYYHFPEFRENSVFQD